jgi:hypothetical protein
MAGTAWAAEDAGLVNQISGGVQFQTPGSPATAVEPFMKIRVGDTIRVAAAARIRIVYFVNGRQELWEGPASFNVGTVASETLTGSAQIAILPVIVSQRLEQSARLLSIAREGRAGSVQVRGIGANLEEARKQYVSLAGSSEPADITPELYLFTVLEGARLHDEMATLLERMKAKQPDNLRVAELGRWLAAQPK